MHSFVGYGSALPQGTFQTHTVSLGVGPAAASVAVAASVAQSLPAGCTSEQLQEHTSPHQRFGINRTKKLAPERVILDRTR